ncbi:DUF1217 domain-containing protein [Yoonia vestfoldensis]|uniref:DUF1217 domain-containing protein n=1 Tax=Yoonia vestfoldensis TaxID=245188 RepID=UPI000373CD61
MSFQPVVPLTGYVGWRFLERTLEPQQAAFAKSQPVVRATDYFRENIGNVTSAADLVNDRRLLSVALGAFGLDDDINNRFFIRKVLEDGTIKDDALANRLADNRYAEFSRAFGFGDRPVPRTILSGFASEMTTRYEKRQFERAVGVQNNDLRLALNLQSGIADIVSRNSSDGAQWFSMMGNTPLRKVFETALGLPASIASIDIDKQRDIFKSRAQANFGTQTMADFSDPAQQEKLIRMFLVRSEASQSAALSGASAALSLLQSMPRVGRLA